MEGRKISASLVRDLAGAAELATAGRVALRAISGDGDRLRIRITTRAWAGRDANRQAAAYLAGVVLATWGGGRLPLARDLVDQLGGRYGAQVEQGRAVVHGLYNAGTL